MPTMKAILVRQYNDPMGYTHSSRSVTLATKTDRKYGWFTGKREGTRIRSIMEYIKINGPTSKYDIVTKVLGYEGSRTTLRGHWCTNFATLRDCGLLNLDYNNNLYDITTKSAKLVYTSEEAPEYFF